MCFVSATNVLDFFRPPPLTYLQDVVAGWQLHDQAGAHRRNAPVLAQDPGNISVEVWIVWMCRWWWRGEETCGGEQLIRHASGMKVCVPTAAVRKQFAGAGIHGVEVPHLPS